MRTSTCVRCEFGQAIHAGNEVFNPRVERALAERAMGFYADKFMWRAI